MTTFVYDTGDNCFKKIDHYWLFHNCVFIAVYHVITNWRKLCIGKCYVQTQGVCVTVNLYNQVICILPEMFR